MTTTTMPSLIPVLSLLVRGTGICDIDNAMTAVPFARELLTRDPDPLEAISIVERFINACPRSEAYAHMHNALREDEARFPDGERFALGDAVNMYAAPGVALGMALAYIAFMEGGVR
jgi:hypothetical protein